MKQEDKQLLLQDLCARLPYNVIVNKIFNGVEHGVYYLDLYKIAELQNDDPVIIKPYLRPMSSMTKEEREFMEELSEFKCTPDKALRKINFYLEHHIDFRGLIPKGLALEATEEMYKSD